MTRIGSPGEGRLGCLLWLALAGVAAMIALTAVPVKLNDIEFGDYLEEQAQFSGRASAETMKARIMKKAKELEIPLDPKTLKVEKNAVRVKISCRYTVTLDFPFYPVDWEFEHKIDRPVFIV
jgi:hypothetical protein